MCVCVCVFAIDLNFFEQLSIYSCVSSDEFMIVFSRINDCFAEYAFVDLCQIVWF